jgi:prepilin-type N-terminal cleavage/methylation domain
MKYQPSRTPRYEFQRGLTLIEIMVAIAISLLLLAGVAQIFISNKQSFRVQEGMSHLQENGRFATHFLGRTMRLAGYHTDPTLDSTKLAILFGAGSEAIIGADNNANGTDNIRDGSDTSTIRHQGHVDGSIQTCLGTAVNPPTPADPNLMAVNTFFVDPTGVLQCRSQILSAIAPTDQTQPLLDGVSDMQILYGVDTSPADANHTVNRYVPGGAVLNWANVRSVRIQLTMNSVESVDPALPNGLIEQTFTTTVSLRNRL